MSERHRARLHSHDHDARMVMPSAVAPRTDDDLLDADVGRILRLELDAVAVLVQRVVEIRGDVGLGPRYSEHGSRGTREPPWRTLRSPQLQRSPRPTSFSNVVRAKLTPLSMGWHIDAAASGSLAHPGNPDSSTAASLETESGVGDNRCVGRDFGQARRRP